ncbi:TIM barrel protein [Robinsoniella peoriensis]|uniref:TIM barrel protein n=1 Tax=Robinsoniella peoriensis TaxID=180332 RepID=UPI003640370C
MKRMINLTDSPDDLKRFRGDQDLLAFCHKFECDGYEYMNIGLNDTCKIPAEQVIGVHLISFNAWMDLWMENEEALIREYDNMDTVEEVFGGRTREALLQKIQKNLDFAQSVNAEYVVFHVSEVKIQESLTYQFDYTDEEVIQAVCQMVNSLLDDKNYKFYFLMENLWWPGFTFTNPRMTQMLMDGIHYGKKGIMLDTGHLLHTNPDIKDLGEGVAYIQKQLDEHGELCSWIKGIHLNQSLTGEVVKEMQKAEIAWKDRYYERWSQIFTYIFQIDLHLPFTDPQVPGLVKRISPLFLTYEFISRSREEHEMLLAGQSAVFQQSGE